MLPWLAISLLSATLASCKPWSPAALRRHLVDQHYHREAETPTRKHTNALECFQITSPVDTENGLAVEDRIIDKHEQSPFCSKLLMKHSFGNSYGQPFVGHYEPPPCEFDYVYINLTVTSEGRQFDRLATMWLGDVEVFRTSTAEPTPPPGIVWYFLKDMTPYLSLWNTSQTLIFDLGNIINDKYTGPFNVTLEATFIKSNQDSSSQGSKRPADLIIPVSAKRSSQNASSAFVFPENKAEASVQIPRQANAAILTVAATGQAAEEFWWSNVPESAADQFNYTNGDRLPGLSSFREVQISIDGQLAGLVWPFPVVFTGGIAPPLHRPMVGLEAFDLRETEIDVSPWLGVLTNGEEHTVTMEVFGVNDTLSGEGELVYAGSNWVLSAKIFVWLGAEKEFSSAPPKITISPENYLSKVSVLDKTSFDYTQTIDRELLIQAFEEDGPSIHCQWTQAFIMINDGKVKESGYFQQVNASYAGHGIYKSGKHGRLETHFRYPISTTYRYETQPDQDILRLDAVLSQGLDLAVTLDSPLITGAEPFSGKLPADPRFSILHAYRDGEAFFQQDTGGNSSYGFGQSTEDLELRALLRGEPFAGLVDHSGTLLYRRSTSVVNETTISDVEVVWDETTKSSASERHHGGDGPSEFAPFPIDLVGGTKIFLKGLGHPDEAILPLNPRPFEGLVTQESTSWPRPYTKLANRLLGDW